jgi:hypothetical protein
MQKMENGSIQHVCFAIIEPVYKIYRIADGRGVISLKNLKRLLPKAMIFGMYFM